MRRTAYFWIIFAVGIIISISSGILRLLSANPTLAGEYSYKHLTQPSSDFFSFAISLIPPHFGYYWALIIIECVILFLLFYQLLRFHTHDDTYILASSILFVLAPSFVYFSSVISPYLTALALLLLALNLLNTRYYWLSLIPFFFLALFDWLVFLVCVCVIVTYAFYWKLDYFRFAGCYTLFFGLVQLVAQRPIVLEVIPVYRATSQIFSDFGGMYGIGLFSTLLALIGFISTWDRKRELIPAYACTLAIFAMALFFTPQALLFLFPLVTLFAAFGLTFLWKRAWIFPILRFLTLTAILYGVLFSSLAYVNHIQSLPPTPAVFESTSWMKQHPMGDGRVLSHPQKGFWLAYGSETAPFITYDDPMYDSKMQVAHQIFYSRDLKNTTSLLQAQNISLIWIDSSMKNGQVWHDKDEGLLFLLRNERFKRVYSREGIEIWRFR